MLKTKRRIDDTWSMLQHSHEDEEVKELYELISEKIQNLIYPDYSILDGKSKMTKKIIWNFDYGYANERYKTILSFLKLLWAHYFTKKNRKNWYGLYKYQGWNELYTLWMEITSLECQKQKSK